MNNVEQIFRNNYLLIYIFLTICVFVSISCEYDFSVLTPKQPSNEEIDKLLKATISDLKESIEEDDFEIIRRNSSEIFKDQVSVSQLKESFHNLVEKKISTVSTLNEISGLDPHFLPNPEIKEENGKYILQTQGFFKTKTSRVNFSLNYLRENGSWKLIKIEVKT